MPSHSDNPAIFISYRRNNSFETDQLYHHLLSRFNSDSIFIDRMDIEPGEPFPDRLKVALEQAAVVLVMIGPDWISTQDPRTFRRRLELPDDWVRNELTVALTHDKIVIPVLIKNAAMPSTEQLPDLLTPLASRNAMVLSNERFNADATALVKVIGDKLGFQRLSRLLRDTGNPYPPEGSYKPLALDETHLRVNARVVAAMEAGLFRRGG